MKEYHLLKKRTTCSLPLIDYKGREAQATKRIQEVYNPNGFTKQTY